MEKTRTLYVDADSCPVKQQIVEVAHQFDIDVIFVSSYAHVTETYSQFKWKYVDCNKEEVDFYIINNVVKDDIVISQDIGLASILLSKGVFVISPRGKIFSEAEIEIHLNIRYLNAKARQQGKYNKGPGRFKQTDKEKFKNSLINILSKKEGF